MIINRLGTARNIFSLVRTRAILYYFYRTVLVVNKRIVTRKFETNTQIFTNLKANMWTIKERVNKLGISCYNVAISHSL